jgi:hypothetical protein
MLVGMTGVAGATDHRGAQPPSEVEGGVLLATDERPTEGHDAEFRAAGKAVLGGGQIREGLQA